MRTLIGAFVVFAAAPLLAQTATTAEVDAFRGVLKTQERTVRLRPNKVILVAGTTSAFTLPKPVANDIRDDYTSKNEKAVALKEISGTKLPVRIADVSAFRGASGYDWAKLVQKYPDADMVVEFSRPGFDRTQSTAVVRATFSRARGTTTYLYQLRLRDGAWAVEQLNGPY